MMKRHSLFAAILIASTIYVVAQPPGGGRGGPGGPPPRQGGGHGEGPPNAVLAAIDADGDHTISAREITNASRALKKLDRNRDGKLTPDEIHGGSEGQHGSPRGERDRGGPPHAGSPGPGAHGPGGGGPPTAEKFLSHAMTFDADDDGVLNKAELQKMAAAVVEEMQHHGAPGGGHGPGGDGQRPGRGGEGRGRQRPPIE